MVKMLSKIVNEISKYQKITMKNSEQLKIKPIIV